MYAKKALGFSAIAISLLFIAGCGSTKTPAISTGEVTTVKENVQTPTLTGTKDATQDQCIEMMAYAFKVAQFQAQGDKTNVQVWAGKASDLEVKYRAQGLEYEQTCNKFLSSNASFMQAVQARVAELK